MEFLKNGTGNNIYFHEITPNWLGSLKGITLTSNLSNIAIWEHSNFWWNEFIQTQCVLVIDLLQQSSNGHSKYQIPYLHCEMFPKNKIFSKHTSRSSIYFINVYLTVVNTYREFYEFSFNLALNSLHPLWTACTS